MQHNPIMKKILQNPSVEWKPLGEVLVRTKGTKITAGQMKELHKHNAPLKIFAGGKTFAQVDFQDIPEKDINWEPSIIVKSRGIIEFEYYEQPFSHKNEMWSYHSNNENISIKFAYYFLKKNEVYFQKLGSRMQMPQIATPDTDTFLIPIPPLEAQREIVRVLDNFTELTAELTARKKQYAYYRDLLLNFEPNSENGENANPFATEQVVWKTLGEVSCFVNGKGHEKNILEHGKYVVVNSKFISTNGQVKKYSDKQISPLFVDDILIVMSDLPNGKALAKTYMVEENNKYTLNQRIGCLSVKSTKFLLPKYLNFFLNRNKQLLRYDNGSDQTNLKKSQILNVKVPIPPLATQAQIVAILDRFDALTNSISEGLPREIALRQKQYEYYRERLLSFQVA